MFEASHYRTFFPWFQFHFFPMRWNNFISIWKKRGHHVFPKTKHLSRIHAFSQKTTKRLNSLWRESLINVHPISSHWILSTVRLSREKKVLELRWWRRTIWCKYRNQFVFVADLWDLDIFKKWFLLRSVQRKQLSPVWLCRKKKRGRDRERDLKEILLMMKRAQ